MAFKIGIVTEYYYPLLGGITENVHNTGIKLKEMGYEVKIIASNYDRARFTVPKSRDLSDPDIIRIGSSLPVYSNGSLAHLTIGKNLRARIRAILEDEKFSILHLHSPTVLTLPLISLLEANCPLVGTFHTYFDRSVIYSVLKELIQKRCIDKLDGQIAVSKTSLEAMSRYFKLHARIIPNGVDTDQFNPSAPRLEKFDDGRMNLLFLSRFDPRNGLALMFRSFEIVKSEFHDVRLIIVGNGPLGFYYRQLVPKALENDIYFEGLVRDNRPTYYATCDVFCSPITKASFGVTLLEAMASCRPIVATENLGYREVLSSDEGFLVSQNDPKAFAEAILHLLKDEQLRKEMGANGLRKALRYSWGRVVHEIVGYYEEILGGT